MLDALQRCVTSTHDGLAKEVETVAVMPNVTLHLFMLMQSLEPFEYQALVKAISTSCSRSTSGVPDNSPDSVADGKPR